MATCPAGHQSASDDFCEVCGVLIGAPPSLALDGDPGDAGSPAAGEPGAAPGAAAPPPGEACPRCGAPRTGHFCEQCGYDFTAAPPPAAAPAPVVPPASAVPPAPVVPPASAVPPSNGSATVVPPGPGGPVPAPPAPGPVGPVSPAAPPAPGPAATAWAAVVTADRTYYDSVQAAGGPDAAGIAFPAYCPQRRFALAGPEVRIGRHSTSSGIDPEIDLSVPPADPGISRLHAVLLQGEDGGWSVVDPGSANGTVVNGSEIPAGQPVPLRDGDRVHLGAWTELRLVREA